MPSGADSADHHRRSNASTSSSVEKVLVVVSECQERNIHAILVYNRVVHPWMSFSMYVIGPFLFMLTSSIIIARKLSQRRRFLERIKGVKSEPSVRTLVASNRVSLDRKSAPVMSGQQAAKHQNLQSQRGTTMLLFAASIEFLLTATPAFFLDLAEKPLKKSGVFDSAKGIAVFQLFYTMVRLLMFSNFALHFFLFCLSAHRFRREVIKVLCCCFLPPSADRSTPVDHGTRLVPGGSSGKSYDATGGGQQKQRKQQQQQQKQKARFASVLVSEGRTTSGVEYLKPVAPNEESVTSVTSVTLSPRISHAGGRVKTIIQKSIRRASEILGVSSQSSAKVGIGDNLELSTAAGQGQQAYRDDGEIVEVALETTAESSHSMRRLLEKEGNRDTDENQDFDYYELYCHLQQSRSFNLMPKKLAQRLSQAATMAPLLISIVNEGAGPSMEPKTTNSDHEQVGRKYQERVNLLPSSLCFENKSATEVEAKDTAPLARWESAFLSRSLSSAASSWRSLMVNRRQSGNRIRTIGNAGAIHGGNSSAGNCSRSSSFTSAMSRRSSLASIKTQRCLINHGSIRRRRSDHRRKKIVYVVLTDATIV